MLNHLILVERQLSRNQGMTRRQRIQSAKFGPFATQDIAVGAFQQQPLAFIAGDLAGASDLSATTIVAGLLGLGLRLMRCVHGERKGMLCQNQQLKNIKK